MGKEGGPTEHNDVPAGRATQLLRSSWRLEQHVLVDVFPKVPEVFVKCNGAVQRSGEAQRRDAVT